MYKTKCPHGQEVHVGLPIEEDSAFRKECEKCMLKDVYKKLKETSISESRLIKDSGESLQRGQIWYLSGRNPDIPSYLVCIHKIWREYVDIEVLFRWTELAGPADLKLPHHFLGSRAVFSFEISATIQKNELDTCIGRLSEDSLTYIAKAQKDLENDLNKPPFSWGNEYIDEYDHRYQYHEKIIENIEKMQQAILKEVWE